MIIVVIFIISFLCFIGICVRMIWNNKGRVNFVLIFCKIFFINNIVKLGVKLLIKILDKKSIFVNVKICFFDKFLIINVDKGIVIVIVNKFFVVIYWIIVGLILNFFIKSGKVIFIDVLIRIFEKFNIVVVIMVGIICYFFLVIKIFLFWLLL